MLRSLTLGLSLSLFSVAAEAGWRPANGVDASLSAHSSLPLTALGSRGFEPGGGLRFGLGYGWTSGQRSLRLGLLMDGLPGGAVPPADGDFLSTTAFVGAGVDTELGEKWLVSPRLSAGWSHVELGRARKDGLLMDLSFAALRRARLRHLSYGFDLGISWLAAAQGVILRAGPVVRWQR